MVKVLSLWPVGKVGCHKFHTNCYLGCLKKRNFITVTAVIKKEPCDKFFSFYCLGHRDVAELLLENVANRDCRTKTGITPLFQVSYKPSQGCALAAPGRLRRPTFGFGRPKNKTGRPTGHPAVLCAVQDCRKACD